MRRLITVLICLVVLLPLAATANHAAVTCQGEVPAEPVCIVTFTAQHDITGMGIGAGGPAVVIHALATDGTRSSQGTCAVAVVAATCRLSGGTFAAGSSITVRVVAEGYGDYRFSLGYAPHPQT